jgi:hypothetical protein
MKVTGYAFREAIRQHELRAKAAADTFDGTLKKFPDEKKPSPQAVIEQFATSERAVARLQSAQAQYNLKVSVDVLGEHMTLSEAVKLVGGVGRIEKMWRNAAGGKKDRYGYGNAQDERDPSKVFAVETVSTDEAVKLASVAAKRAGAFRSAIATANAREVEIENLDPALFE